MALNLRFYGEDTVFTTQTGVINTELGPSVNYTFQNNDGVGMTLTAFGHGRMSVKLLDADDNVLGSSSILFGPNGAELTAGVVEAPETSIEVDVNKHLNCLLSADDYTAGKVVFDCTGKIESAMMIVPKSVGLYSELYFSSLNGTGRFGFEFPIGFVEVA